MDDTIFLSHILEETDFLLSLTSSHDIEFIISDPIVSRAVRSSLETIGDAAKNLSQSFRNEHSEIFWKGIIGMRDRLIHHYFGIDWDLIVDVLNDEIPRLHSDVTIILGYPKP
jgi:uncharacterized protein with HEPN domain